MYKQHFGKPRNSSAGPRSFHGSRPRGGNQKRGFSGHSINVSKFINKAIVGEVILAYKPKHLFNDFAISDSIKASIAKKGYILPTAIQDQAIPHVLAGSDVVGIANTGTGKTAAFLIPLIEKMLKDKNECALIVVPTRELAQQIDEELKGFVHGMGIFSVTCVGGANISKQLRDLRYRNNFVIGTPGRLRDLIERKALNLSNFKTVVLDEADRMLDMGFINDMRYMMAKMSPNRQTLFFSATMSREIEILIKDFLKNPITVSVKTGDTAKSVDQDVVRVGREEKIDVLHNLLNKKDEFKKVLIFGRTKHGVERLGKDLIKRGITAESIHGDKRQNKREQALGLFKTNKVQVLVATDVAARGIDVSDVSHVINYDIPATYEDYIHRIGRTGRGGKAGKALTFV